MKKVIVLMSTYNGEKYIKTQLDSILAQKGVEVQLVVRDDGSTDNTLKILQQYAQNGQLRYYTGPNLKSAKSFMDLLIHASKADFYAFSDQDDYWLPDKLLRGVKELEQISDQSMPSLYYSKPLLVDEDLRPLKKQMHMQSKYTFPQALFEISIAGCTLVFNNALLNLARRYIPTYVGMHDAWLGLLCLAVNGKLVYDSVPSIYYRQHVNNVCGTGYSLKRRWIKRFRHLFKPETRLSDMLRDLMKGFGDMMPAGNGSLCLKVINYQNGWRYKWDLLRDKSIRSDNKRKNLVHFFKILIGTY